MKKYLIGFCIFLIFIVFNYNRGNAQPLIGTYPPQVHQQICQESTFTRYLEVFNSGDEALVFNAVLSPDTVAWVSASPLSGEIGPGDTALIEFNFNSTGLPLDNYYADLIISSNDPVNPEVAVLAMLHVQDLTIFLEPDEDSICQGCSTQLNVIVLGCSEMYAFNWTSDPPGFASTEKSPVVSPLVNTTYTVTVTDGGYSSQKSVEIKVEGSSGMNDNSYLSEIKIYPNPGSGQIVVKFLSELNVQGLISIIDFAGKTLQTEEMTIELGINELPVKLVNLAPGMYHLTVQPVNNPTQPLIPSAKIFIY